MQCPNPSCQYDPLLPNVKTELVMSERSGIEIDYCPRCRGIWLDRGELDKLLEKTAAESEPASQSRGDSWQQRDAHYARRDGDYGKHNDDYKNRSYDNSYNKSRHSGSHKKKSLLSELFDF